MTIVETLRFAQGITIGYGDTITKVVLGSLKFYLHNGGYHKYKNEENMVQSESIISQILNPDIPEILFHYTSSAGLIGIVNSKKIWTTKIHYLNDGSELKLAFKYIRDEIELQKSDSNRMRSIQELDEMIEALDSIEEINVSVASFTEKDDQLSQWRGYCKIGEGYSLGFDGKALNENVKNKNDYYLVPCVYEEDIQKLLARELVNSTLVRGVLQNPKPSDSLLHRMSFSNAALLIAPMVKAKGFEEEKEWRLISRPLYFEDAKFRHGNFSMLPYWEFDLDLKNTLKSITIGPTPEQKLSFGAVRGLFLKEFSDDLNFQSKFKITSSSIPFRNI